MPLTLGTRSKNRGTFMTTEEQKTLNEAAPPGYKARVKHWSTACDGKNVGNTKLDALKWHLALLLIYDVQVALDSRLLYVPSHAEWGASSESFAQIKSVGH